ncbi:mitochondrial ribonuclease P catalytic subunit [Colletes gigas]|uniref:mitochondrial ribonuclease P catalytic subunit n=1 Tax=Colletes gigas TaxID=935657 RepID=UPI001C9AB472|nr:mitochondrial ribonuclease P catalytic subunit [Colletes gigas]
MAFLKNLTNLCLYRIQFYCVHNAPSAFFSMFHRFKRNQKIISRDTIVTLQKQYEEKLLNSHVSKETWEGLKKDLLDMQRFEPTSVDTVIMELCCDERFVDAGLSYYNFMMQNNPQLSAAITSKLFKLYEKKPSPITEAEKVYLSDLYKTMIERYVVLDQLTTSYYIGVLCKTGQWKKSIDVIKYYEGHNSKFLKIGYSSLINYFLENGMMKLAEKYLLCIFERSYAPCNDVYINYLKYCLKEMKTFNENIEKLFTLWRDYDIKPHMDVVTEYMKTCNAVGWFAEITTIKDSMCQICKQNLSAAKLSEEEFEYLSNSVMQKFLVDKNYEISHPKELKRFIDFIDKTKPFDVVIDGLNVLYSNNNSSHSQKYMNVQRLFTNFVDQKVLIIGRQHMKCIPIVKNLQEQATFFFVDNISKDDPFLLYAALASKSNTKIISNDFMRQHKFCLDDSKLRILFKKWQCTHQYKMVESRNSVQLKLLNSVGCDGLHYVHSGAQKHNNCWHVPFQNASTTAMNVEYVHEKNWICFNMCNSKSR